MDCGNCDMQQHLQTESDLLTFAAEVARAIKSGAIIFLSGPLGAGKTTFARGFLRGLGYRGKVKSPTYTLVEPYEVADKIIYHCDFYRLQNATELEQIGMSDYFTPTSICLIEWPEKGFPLLPQPDVACYIEFMDIGRTIKVEAVSARGHEILSQLE